MRGAHFCFDKCEHCTYIGITATGDTEMALAKAMTFAALAISAFALIANGLGAFEMSQIQKIALLISTGVAAVAAVALITAD